MPKVIKRKHSSTGSRRLTIQYAPTEKFKQHAHNSRTHGEENIQAIIKSYESFGEMQPIVVNKRFEILAGNGRHEAAMRVGLKELAYVMPAWLTPAQEEAFQIADNKTSDMSTFDSEKLSIQLMRISGMGIDMDTTGFTAREREPLLVSDLPDAPEGFAPGDIATFDGGASGMFGEDTSLGKLFVVYDVSDDSQHNWIKQRLGIDGTKLTYHVLECANYKGGQDASTAQSRTEAAQKVVRKVTRRG